MEIGGDVDALAAALSLADGEDLFLTDLTADLTGSLQSFAPSGTVFAPLGDVNDAWQTLSLPGVTTPVGTTECRAAGCQAEESPQTEGTDSDGQSQGSCGSSCGSAASASRTRAPSKPAAKKRALNYNPNRAREERRKEVIALRLEAAALESQLATLQNVADHQRTRRLTKHPRAASTSIAHTVWKSMAERQLGKRLEASRENGDLKAAVRAKHSTIRRMAKLLRSATAERAARMFTIERFHQLMEYVELKLDPALVERLMAGTTECYRQVDSVFANVQVDTSRAVSLSVPEMQTDADGHLFTRVQASKVFPYGVHATGIAAWTQFSESVRPNARCFFAEILQNTEDVVVERFGTELHLDDGKVVVHVRQVKRKFVEADRIVVVWQSLVDPIEFRGQRLRGASFEERGFFVIRRSPQLPDGFSLLQTCYLISPSAPMRSVPQDALTVAVTEFVQRWMTSTIPVNHQIIEDILLDLSLVRGARTVHVLPPEDLAALAAMQSFIDEYAALLDGSAESSAASAGLCVDRGVGGGAAAKKKAPAKRRPRANTRPTGTSQRSSNYTSPPAGEPSPVPASATALPPPEDACGLQAPKPRAKYNYNPNRARDGERRELTELRGQVDDLTQELEALEEARRACDQCLGRGRSTRRRGSKRGSQGESAAAHESVELPRDRARAAEVWKEIANDQFQLHMRAVRENRRLKRVVEGHREVTDELKRLLEQRTASEPIKLFETAPRAWPMMALAPDLSDKEIYQELLNGLDPSYREAEDIFLRSGLSESDVSSGSHTQMHEDGSGNLFAQIFAHKIFPFDVRTTGLVCWKIFSFCVRPNCTSFFSQLGAENVEESDDTVAESFGIEFREQGTTALFRGKQIKRMYIEEDRVVIVWHAFVNPIEFDGRPLAGAAFRECGYFIVKRPSNVAPDATFALLQSCYVLTPNVPVRTLPQDSVAGALVSFVLNCMAASVPENHQIIENSLFDEQMERHMQRGHHCS